MSKTFRKLIGLMLCVCLLLPCLSAMAAGADESGGALACEITVELNAAKGFTDASGIALNLFKVAEPDETSPNGWKACGFFETYKPVSGLFASASSDAEAFAKKLTTEVTSALASDSTGAFSAYNSEPLKVGDTNIVSTRVEPGIYYGCQASVGSNPLVKINPFVFSASPHKKGGKVEFKIAGDKIEYTEVPPVDVYVKKVWMDDDNFDGYRPGSLVVKLMQNGSELEEHTITAPTSADEDWSWKWENLPAADAQGQRYAYAVEEVRDSHYDLSASVIISVKRDWKTGETPKAIDVELFQNGASIEKMRLAASGDAISFNEHPAGYNYTFTATATDGTNESYNIKASYSYTLTNTHTPKYGSLKVSKQVLVDGREPSGKKLNDADGIYYFTLTGPEELPVERRNKGKKNYYDDENPDNKLFVTIVDGKTAESGAIDGLMPGTYTVKEVTDGLSKKGMAARVESQEVKVVAGETAKPSQSFVNEMTTGSLKLTKKVVYDEDDSTPASSVVNATFNFTITGPDNFTTVVPIKYTNGRPQTTTLQGLEAGTYTITEGEPVIHSHARQFQKFNTPEPQEVVLEIRPGQTGAVVEAEFENRLVTATPTPTPTPTPTRTATPTPNNGGGGGGGTNRTRTTTPPPGETPTPPSQTTPPANTTVPPDETPTPTPTPTPSNMVTPTPVPTPTPTPVTNVTIRKVWDDDSNVHRTRPNSITVSLLRNGEQINLVRMTGTGDNWSYTFNNLPAVDGNGRPYSYLAREETVSGYTTELDGTTITNRLIRKPPERYISISGIKIWRDQDNAEGARPREIIVRLMRDGIEVERRTVTTLQNWQFSFDHIPEDDGFGNKYTYTIQEEAVNGYFARFDGSTITNTRLPRRAYMPALIEEDIDYETFRDSGTPLAGFPMAENELEELLTLFDYPVPLWGEPMKTGDELPIYPIIFGSVGLCALIAVVVLSNMEKKKKRAGM